MLVLLSPLIARKYSAKGICIVWLVIAFRLLIPVNVHLINAAIEIPVPKGLSFSGSEAQRESENRPPFFVTPQPAYSSNQNQASQGSTTNSGNQSPADSTYPIVKLSLLEIFTFVWAAGALVFALMHFTGYLLLKRDIRRYAKTIDNRAALDVYRRVLMEAKIKASRVSMLAYSRIQSPMMTGFIRPTILLPDTGFHDLGELELIIRHELAHYKRKDIWLKLIMTCANAIHWFNPLVYLMVRESNRQIENACDQTIVNGADMHLRKKYCESILAAMESGHTKRLGLSTHYHGGKGIMKQRFINIFDVRSKKRGASIIIAVMLATMMSTVLVACQTADTSNLPSASETPAPSDISPSTTTVSPAETDDSKDIVTIAAGWAEAVKNRDGKAQYELMTKALQEKVYGEFAGLNWVTGTSSPWVTSFEVEEHNGSVRVTFTYATSTGPAGSYYQDLTFKEEDGMLKMDSISDSQETAAPETDTTSFQSLIGLLGMTKEELLAAVPETPVGVDEGGIGFDKTGFRVWFDDETHTKVAQVLIMSDKIDINGVKVGDSYDAFKEVFGKPISDTNGDAHFKYEDVYLSVVRDVNSGKGIAVYILAENF